MQYLISDDELLAHALKSARDTRSLTLSAGARHDTAAVFENCFGSCEAIIVADENTFRVAGKDVVDSLARRGQTCAKPHIFASSVYAEYASVEELAARLRENNAIPIAVGSGTINDLTKLASHRVNRPYIAVATAASMDGYTAYGASITDQGSKQTFDCPAPQAVIADLDVIVEAPVGMNASGYADLMAKCPAGADWILADAAGEEAIDGPVWDTVQKELRRWLSDARGIAEGNPVSIRNLTLGLMMTGFAMQSLRSSRPASGADHQFSHLWDMQHHTYHGVAPSHGFKVGIGALSSLALYDDLLSYDFAQLAVDAAIENWPTLQKIEERIRELLGDGELSVKAVEESRAKYKSKESLRSQLQMLKSRWPEVSQRITSHTPCFAEVRDMLKEAGCPVEPEQIGISRERLRTSYEQAWYIRRRYTVLDFMQRAGLADAALRRIFDGSGPWSSSRNKAVVQ